MISTSAGTTNNDIVFRLDPSCNAVLAGALPCCLSRCSRGASFYSFSAQLTFSSAEVHFLFDLGLS